MESRQNHFWYALVAPPFPPLPPLSPPIQCLLEKLTAAIKQDIANFERLAGRQSDSTTLAERDWVETSLGNESLDRQ
jgi:hypothetical protein